MPASKFLQIHSLASYPAALLNRDDSGQAKRITYGGVPRTRISSQCLKRHWRIDDGQFSFHNIDGTDEAFRSRKVVERLVMAPLRRRNVINPDVFSAVQDAFIIGVYAGGDAKEEAKKRVLAEEGRQPLLLGSSEVEFLQKNAVAIYDRHPDDPEGATEEASQLFNGKESSANFQAFRENTKLPGGIEGAMFGRMVTSDPAAKIESAIHVAHAFTVHQEETESDYFTVVDDLHLKDEHGGSAHIGITELTSGLFYGYVVVDVAGLVSNLEGCPAGEWLSAERRLASHMVKNLVGLISTVSPGAKLGSTAPYSRARFMMLEVGDVQPFSLADAFRNPVEPQMDMALDALSKEMYRQDQCYGAENVRRYMAVDDCDIPSSTRVNHNQLGEWAAQVVLDGEV